ncbi:MAG: M13 family metallopeptidase [Hyphomonadaceae bacterium]|nr:MAG: putative endopeptidase [Caulobacteraceae bacterium]MBT9447422.1 M13 family metallopeptidase [Hyphomonadaceae bacterium]TPW07490.1 MAG: putative endopeptidase [Alphaproteobacteria bacterium]
MDRRTFLRAGASLAVVSAVAACVKKPAAAPAKAELGAWGVELDARNTAIAPGDDFFRHVNGAWLDRTEIPADKSSFGAFDIVYDRAEVQVRAIIEDSAKSGAAAGTVEKKIGDYYNAFMDEAGVEAKGASPLKTSLDAIAAAPDKATLATLFGTAGYPSPIDFYVNVDSKNSDRYLMNLVQGGIGLPNRDYLLLPKFAEQAGKYRAYLEQILTLAGVSDPGARATRVFALERRIAQAHWALEEQRDAIKTYNLVDVATLNTTAPGLDWTLFLKAMGADGVAQVSLNEKTALQKIAALVASRPLDEWKDWMTAHRINGAARYLSKAFVDARFEFFGKVLNGQQQNRERWKRGVGAVDDALGEAIGQVYVKRHFPEDSKAKMQVLVDNLLKAMKPRIEALDWMSAETKAKALEKLSTFGTKIGYPNKWRDYTSLDVQAGDLLGNVDRAGAFNTAWEIGKLKRPIDRDEWLMTPQTVNAYYWAEKNEIVFPAAILQPPFFDPAADPAVNYGAIGAVIGHEITHGFDDQGRLYNAKGLLQTWWTPDDDRKFNERAKRIVDLYSSFEPIPGFKMNGQQTLGEDIADVGGVLVALDAYKLSLNGQEAPVLDGLSGDQRFFLAYAQAWREKVREEALKQQITSDVHSPAEFRVNGTLRNVDAWYAAFNVVEGQKMFVAPDARAKIW